MSLIDQALNGLYTKCGLEFIILLLSSPECKDYSYILLFSVCIMPRFELTTLSCQASIHQLHYIPATIPDLYMTYLGNSSSVTRCDVAKYVH